MFIHFRRLSPKTLKHSASPAAYLLSHTSDMCKFIYQETQPCGCRLYHGNKDVQFCPTETKTGGDSSGMLTTVLIRRTDELGDFDSCSQGIRFMTVPKDGNFQFKWLYCQKQDHVLGKTTQRAEHGCPWHDSLARKRELMSRRDAKNERRQEEADRTKATKKVAEKDCVIQ